MKLLFASITLCIGLVASTAIQAAPASGANQPLLVPLVKGPAPGLAEAHYQVARCAALYINMSNLVGARDQALADSLNAKGKHTFELAQISGRELGRSFEDVSQTVVAIVVLYKKLWEQNYYATGESLEEISKSDLQQCNYMIDSPADYLKAI